MRSHGDTHTQAVAARAVERVLRAERDAQLRIEQAHSDAQALLSAARDDALAIVNRALERSARWQRGHATALQVRLDTLRAQADHVREPPPEAGVLQAAVDQVAARLTGAPADADDGDDRAA